MTLSANQASNDITRPNADVDAQRVSQGQWRFGVEFVQSLTHSQGSTYGTFWIIFVRAGCAKDGHNRVAHVFVYGPFVTIDTLAELSETGIDEGHHHFCIALFRHSREA